MAAGLPPGTIADMAAAYGDRARGQWVRRAWTTHAETTLLVADTTAVTGWRVIAEFESEDDARLAAAAPALLEALQAFMALDPTFSTCCDRALAELVAEGDRMAPVVQKARAAIAIATPKETPC